MPKWMSVIISNTWSIITTFFFSTAVETESKISRESCFYPSLLVLQRQRNWLFPVWCYQADRFFFYSIFKWKLVTCNFYLLFSVLVSMTMENCSWSSSLYASDRSYNGFPQFFLQTKHLKFISLYSQCVSTPLSSLLHSLLFPGMGHSESRRGVASPRLSRDKWELHVSWHSASSDDLQNFVPISSTSLLFCFRCCIG